MRSKGGSEYIRTRPYFFADFDRERSQLVRADERNFTRPALRDLMVGADGIEPPTAGV